MIPSPLTGGPTTLVTTIPSQTIIDLYAPIADVRRFFAGVPEVAIYECTETSYRFYHPATLAGDGPFYEELAKEQLYYVPWKHEHAVADRFIKTGSAVLELGCANGDFLVEMMRRKQIAAFGTEINATVRRTAEARGISFDEDASVDVTCAFQVLEHIADVRSFIEGALKRTRAGGYLIFGVPDNNSLIRHDTAAYLNMPPHHMGLWTPDSLRALAKHFPLSVITIETEPLQPNHYRWYYQIHFGNYVQRAGLIGRVINKVLFELLARPLIALCARRISGHTVVAVFRKN